LVERESQLSVQRYQRGKGGNFRAKKEGKACRGPKKTGEKGKIKRAVWGGVKVQTHPKKASISVGERGLTASTRGVGGVTGKTLGGVHSVRRRDKEIKECVWEGKEHLKEKYLT